jgi:hypothetical protein
MLTDVSEELTASIIRVIPGGVCTKLVRDHPDNGRQ